MLLYNVTFGIDKAIEAEWISWMKTNYLTPMMGTGLFIEYKMYKVLTHDDDASVSYSVQCFAKSIEDILKYLNEHAPQLTEIHREKFKDRHVAFNTLLEEI
jgi:Domain of unknown function (DUF4286)